MKLLNFTLEFVRKIFIPFNKVWSSLGDNAKNYVSVLLCCVLFIGYGYSYIDFEYYYYGIIPFVLLAILLYYFQLDKVLYLVALLTPFSITMLVGETTAISILTEPFLITFALLYFVKFFLEGNYELRILKHPISIAIYIYLSWMLITAFSSTNLLVSLKYFSSKLFFIIPFFLAIIPLMKDIKKIKLLYTLYGISLALVVLYASISFALKGFEFEYSFYIMQPFYNDHTAYGAILAMFTPLAFLFFVSKDHSKWKRFFFFILFSIYILGLILSYSRAAWMSILPSIGIYFILKFRIKLKLILSIIISSILIFFMFQSSILQLLEKNNQDSSGNIAEHITSISNISTDASNVERLNRWFCVSRMFREKPFFGWGPGTYQFEYAGFQKSNQLSTISTNAGNLGNAHSEYFGALADSGLFGMISVLILFITVMSIGIKVYKTSEDKRVGLLALFLTMSLVTYYTHGFLNNFLDTDKLSVPFWFFTASIVALDVYSKKKEIKVQ